MKTLCYYLNGNYVPALAEVMKTIPCFVYYDETDDSITIECREEDVAFVEKSLQDFV